MDNAVGSREAPPIVLFSKKRQTLALTKQEFEVLVGSVLGDGYITKLGRIQIEQSEHQRQYVEWKYELLKRVVSTRIVSVERKTLSGRVTKSYRFWTKQYFHSWRDIFYPEGKKIISAGIAGVLSPLSFAVWFMDDGFLRKDDAVAIATDKFSLEGLEMIVAGLWDRYGIRASIVKRGRLYLGKEATKRFVKIIRPHVAPTMTYKLP